MNFRNAEEKIFCAVSCLAAAFAIAILSYIIFTIFTAALPSLSLEFITTAESDFPGVGGAIANAITGTIIISICATLIATPFAIGTAIYLQKYARESLFTKTVRFLIEVLSGTPSIVIGIFGLLILVYYLRDITGGFSLISGSIALSILTMPVIERAAEDAIVAVPKSIEGGSYALGANKWQTIRNITLPTAISGITTGIILGFGRAAEESAVVILTAGYTQFMPEFAIKSTDKLVSGFKVYPLQDLVGTLPYSVYHGYENSNIIPMSDAFAAAFVLIAIVLGINTIVKVILWRYKIEV
ncbi:MAG: phosphate ABC transporter permease PstA [Methanomicrobiaceae archaeon]|nr:phosphate ABC transporter permease PstA [Methanomicrobiaceae archaeon]